MTESESEQGGPDRGQWVGVAANAGSGRGVARRAVGRLVGELGRYGISTRVAWTPTERAALVEAAAREGSCRCLVAAGGDGTVAALVNDRPGVPISVLPTGTENLFARHFGLARSPGRLAATIARGRLERIDLGRASGRRFALMAGIGFDADVVTRHHVARLGSAGVMRPTRRAAYVQPVLRASFGYRFPRLSVTIADPGREETLEATTAFIFNLPRYALGLPFVPTARADDGLLDLIMFRDAGPLQALRYLWLVLRGIHLDRPGVEHRRVARVAIASTDPIPVQLDGDPGGVVGPGTAAPFSVEVIPHALDILVPGLRIPATLGAGWA